MSLYDKASLIQIPSGYKASKLYSVIPNSGAGDFTHTRSGVATRVNPQGLIEDVSANVPRLDYPFIDGVVQDCPHLLLEPQRTNSLLYSEDFTQSVWSKQGSSSVLGNTTIAPDGSLTADTLSGATGTSVSGTVLRINVGGTVDSTLSIYVKSLGSTNFTIYMRNGSSGQVQSQSITPTDNWQRVTLTHDPDNGQVYFGNTNGDVAIWGAQLEEGDYPTSYIPTAASSVTRLKDECFNGGDSDLFNITEGTFFIDVNPFVPNANTNIGISNGTDSQKIVFIFQSNGTQVRTYSSGGVSEYDSLTFNQRNKIAVSFKTNEYKIFINGTKVGTDTSASVPTGMDRLNFSNRTNSSSYFEGEVYQAMIFNEALSDSELQTLTTL